VDVLNEAICFDAITYRPDRAIALDRFFWPPIIRATGADWDVVRGLLRRTGRHAGPPAPVGSWELLDFRRLLQELTNCLHANRIEQLQAIICAAADAIRAQQPYELSPVYSVVTARRRRRRVRPSVAEEIEPPHVVPLKQPADVVKPERATVAEPKKPAVSLETTSPLSLDVQTLAYYLWEQKGRPDNADRQCWYEAEQLIAKAFAEQTRRAAAFDYSERRPAA
jgi:hypothetical protein